jgi:hypothetical protein
MEGQDVNESGEKGIGARGTGGKEQGEKGMKV